MNERERIVREAIIALHKVGLKIESFAVHPEVFCEMVSDHCMQMELLRDPLKYPKSTYCGIVVNQVV